MHKIKFHEFNGDFKDNMDFFTHFLVPFIILFALKSKNKLEGAFGGIAPDLDTIFIAWIGFLATISFCFLT